MKLGVFFFGDRKELTGAGAVVRSFATDDELFYKNGVKKVVVYDQQQTIAHNVRRRNSLSFLKKTLITLQ